MSFIYICIYKSLKVDIDIDGIWEFQYNNDECYHEFHCETSRERNTTFEVWNNYSQFWCYQGGTRKIEMKKPRHRAAAFTNLGVVVKGVNIFSLGI